MISKNEAVFARAPIACLVADLLKLAKLEPRVVLDLTYGFGLFWKAYRPKLIIALDPFPENSKQWIVAPDIYCPRAAWQWEWCIKPLTEFGIRIDLVAVDPPWTTQPSSQRRIYGVRIGSTKLILEAAAQAARRLNVPILVHYGEKWKPQDFEVIIEVWFKAIYRARNRDKTTWFAILKPRQC